MQTPYKTILIDDEKLAVKRLHRLLSRHTHVFEIIGEAYNGQEGHAIVEALKPDLIFLDIEMPLMNGFDMLAQLSHVPKVVFSTAFDEYAIRAFEENSVDYLLKPVEEERLKRTINKLQRLSEGNGASGYAQQLAQLIEQFKPKKEIVSMPVKTGDRILLIRLSEITHFEAEDKYVYLCIADNKKYLIDYTLTALDDKLPDNFIRINRSTIVNKEYIKEIQKYFNGRFVVVLNNKAQTKVTSGLSFVDNVRRLLEI